MVVKDILNEITDSMDIGFEQALRGRERTEAALAIDGNLQKS